MNKLIVLLSFLFLLISCKKESNDKDSQSKIFIGSYRIVDQVIPYPFIFLKENDSISKFDHKGVKISSGVINKDTFLLDKERFVILNDNKENRLIFNETDTINFPRLDNGQIYWKYGAFIKETENTPDVFNQKDNIQLQLEKYAWRFKDTINHAKEYNDDFDIEKYYQFANDTVIEVTSYNYKNELITSEKQSFNYHIFSLDKSLFLSFSKDKENPQPIFQITGFEKDNITLKNFSLKRDPVEMIWDKQLKSENFRNLLAASHPYSNCFDGMQGQYYHDDITYNKGNEFILDLVNKNVPQIDTGNGYVIIHFNINCHKDIGDWGLIQMSRNYKSTSFSPKLIKHLTTRIKKLKDWPSINKDSKWFTYKDVHAFLMFKIKDGKITDLCP